MENRDRIAIKQFLEPKLRENREVREAVRLVSIEVGLEVCSGVVSSNWGVLYARPQSVQCTPAKYS